MPLVVKELTSVYYYRVLTYTTMFSIRVWDSHDSGELASCGDSLYATPRWERSESGVHGARRSG